MKKAILIIAIAACDVVFSQTGNVGINTDNPKRTLDINGNLRIRNLENVSDNSNYSKVLVTDSIGNIDHVLRSDLVPETDEFTVNKEVINNLYTNETGIADPLRVITCGEFKFRFILPPNSENGNMPTIQFGLDKKPTTTLNIYISMEQNWSNNGFQFFQGTSKDNTSFFVVSDNVTPVLDSNNKTIGYNGFTSFAEGHLADYEQNIIHFQYPGQKHLYRLLIYKVTYTTTNSLNTSTIKHDFITACEKF